mgnify:CR=1 FL=1
MKLKRLASTLAAAAIAGGGAISMSAVAAAPAYADGGGSHGRGHGFHGHGLHTAHGFGQGAHLCVAKSHKKVIKKRGHGKFGRYFGKGRTHVVKKVANRYVKCGSWHRHHHKRLGHHKFGKFGHKGFDHKGFDHKGFGFDDWGHKGFGGGWGW